jgi:hypothetical protein
MADRIDKVVAAVRGGARQVNQAARGRFGIYSALAKEHGKLSGLMSRLADTGSDEGTRRAELFAEVRDELLAHSQAEDEVFYSALAGYPPLAEKIAHAREEHEEIETLLAELGAMDVQHQSWMNKFLRLKDSVSHHVGDEEGEIFPLAGDVLSRDDADRLEDEFKARRNPS